MDFKTGGQQVILRLVEAYGFSTRQMLCDHLGVSKSTLATRFMRDIFPAEWVIQCALETNVSLEWLCTGEGNSNRNNVQDIVRIPTSKISDGKLIDSSFFFYDKAMLSTSIRKPHIYISDSSYFIAEKNYTEVVDGQWVINIDGMVTLKT
ncbi:phage repressor protein CI, partial [Rahnella sp. SL6]|uniref:phage repressor protein CI n=1 Tax=Rahnella perminowiae TaxID=2816244 RepID=UPI001C266C5B